MDTRPSEPNTQAPAGIPFSSPPHKKAPLFIRALFSFNYFM